MSLLKHIDHLVGRRVVVFCVGECYDRRFIFSLVDLALGFGEKTRKGVGVDG